MKRRSTIPALLVVLSAALPACQQIGFAENEVDHTAVRDTGESREAVHVVVQHVLIAHEEAGIAGVTRSIEQAEALAKQVMAKAEAGEDFTQLVNLYGDDRSAAGVIAIANFGASTTTPEEIERVGLVRGFGDLAFGMEPNEIALVHYDPIRSPYGYHVVKRLR